MDYVVFLAKYWLGYIQGDFFTILSGHPACIDNFTKILPFKCCLQTHVTLAATKILKN
jgi:hypothetical protein